jgi:hypothetical protein
LAVAQQAGVLRKIDIRFAALQFLEMVMGPADLLAHYGQPALAGARRGEFIDQVVDMFLGGCRANPGAVVSPARRAPRTKNTSV